MYIKILVFSVCVSQANWRIPCVKLIQLRTGICSGRCKINCLELGV